MKHIYFLVLLASVLSASRPAAAEGSHALAMNGQPKYGAEFTHFDYAFPDAPKGGTVRMAAIGTFEIGRAHV